MKTHVQDLCIEWKSGVDPGQMHKERKQGGATVFFFFFCGILSYQFDHLQQNRREKCIVHCRHCEFLNSGICFEK